MTVEIHDDETETDPGPSLGSPFSGWYEAHDLDPGVNQVPADGGWVLVTRPPHAEYTVRPFSIWWAVPWPMPTDQCRVWHRVKLVTPRGSLGLFPSEYSRVQDLGKYLEFIDQPDGWTLESIAGGPSFPEARLFYLLSRGVSRAEAVKMLLPSLADGSGVWPQPTDLLADTMSPGWRRMDPSRII